MENNTVENVSNKVNYLFLIWLILFVARITGHIDWDWWIVFIPLAPFMIGLSILCCVICFAILVGIVVAIAALLWWIFESIRDMF